MFKTKVDWWLGSHLESHKAYDCNGSFNVPYSKTWTLRPQIRTWYGKKTMGEFKIISESEAKILQSLVDDKKVYARTAQHFYGEMDV